MALLRASRDRGQYHLLSPQRGRALREMVGDAQGNCAASERAPPQLPAPKMAPYDYFKRSAAIAAPRLAIELMPSPVESDADIERVIALSR